MARYDTKGVYAFRHTHACLRRRSQGHALLSRRCLWYAITLTVCMLSSIHMRVDRTLAGTPLARGAVSDAI